MSFYVFESVEVKCGQHIIGYCVRLTNSFPAGDFSASLSSLSIDNHDQMNKRKDSARRHLAFKNPEDNEDTFIDGQINYTRAHFEKKVKKAGDREEGIYRKNFHLDKQDDSIWKYLPLEIKQYIIYLWENSMVYEKLHDFEEHSCGKVLYKVSKELKRAWKIGNVYLTNWGCYYGGYFREGSYGNCRYEVTFIASQTGKKELEEGATPERGALKYIPYMDKSVVRPFYEEDKIKIWPHYGSATVKLS